MEVIIFFTVISYIIIMPMIFINGIDLKLGIAVLVITAGVGIAGPFLIENHFNLMEETESYILKNEKAELFTQLVGHMKNKGLILDTDSTELAEEKAFLYIKISIIISIVYSLLLYIMSNEFEKYKYKRIYDSISEIKDKRIDENFR